MKRIIKTIILITLITIPQVKAITSDEVLYQEDTVTSALDELNGSLNICSTSGDATADSILSGKSAYVQGKLVVGTLEIPASKIAQGQSIGGVTGTYTSDADATAAQILKDKTAYVNGAKVTGTIPSKGASTYTPGTSNQTISASQYLSGAQTIKGDSNLKAGNIACGVTIFGVKGTKGCVGDTTATTKTGLAATAQVGEYVQMTPTIASYVVPKALTGHTSTVTIKPSELKLWRIIRINNDGTIEMVSEYVSSTAVTFNGQTGYKNFVGALNTLASLYANYEYTLTTRHMGFNGQTEFLTATLSKETCGTSHTTDNSKETSGCGDIEYETDTELVKTAVGTLVANKVTATTTATIYWLASRFFQSLDDQYSYFNGRVVYPDGDVVNSSLVGSNWGSLYDSPTYSYAYLRPIVTLKAGVAAASGSGTKAKPWVLS